MLRSLRNQLHSWVSARAPLQNSEKCSDLIPRSLSFHQRTAFSLQPSAPPEVVFHDCSWDQSKLGKINVKSSLYLSLAVGIHPGDMRRVTALSWNSIVWKQTGSRSNLGNLLHHTTLWTLLAGVVWGREVVEEKCLSTLLSETCIYIIGTNCYNSGAQVEGSIPSYQIVPRKWFYLFPHWNEEAVECSSLYNHNLKFHVFMVFLVFQKWIWGRWLVFKAATWMSLKHSLKGHFIIASLYIFTTCTNWNITYI